MGGPSIQLVRVEKFSPEEKAQILGYFKENASRFDETGLIEFKRDYIADKYPEYDPCTIGFGFENDNKEDDLERKSFVDALGVEPEQFISLWADCNRPGDHLILVRLVQYFLEKYRMWVF